MLGAMTQALLLMDIQNGVIDLVGAGSDYLDRVVATQERAEQADADVLVVLVRVAFGPGHPEISARNKTYAAIKAHRGLVHGDPAADPHPHQIRGNGEIVVTKKRVSAFAGSDLELVLRSHNVTSLVLGGMLTSGVVLSTVRDASDRDYHITVLADLCLDLDEEVHRVLIQKVFPTQADVMAAADWCPDNYSTA
jgi:nicotinamidase-related amidase